MKRERDTRVYLEDILAAASKAIAFTEGLSFEEFVRDDRTTFAVIRAFEILGEAAKRVPDSTRERTSRIPCRTWPGCATS